MRKLKSTAEERSKVRYANQGKFNHGTSFGVCASKYIPPIESKKSGICPKKPKPWEGKIVRLELDSGRILWYHNNNPQQKSYYGFWLDDAGFEWDVNLKTLTARQLLLRFPDYARHEP